MLIVHYLCKYNSYRLSTPPAFSRILRKSYVTWISVYSHVLWGDSSSFLCTTTMSYFLPHLPSGWHVDEAIKSEEDRVVVIRFGHDWDSQCMTMDETLYATAEKVQNFAVIYLCDITKVPDFNKVNLIHCIMREISDESDLIWPGLDVWIVWSLHCDVLLSVGCVISGRSMQISHPLILQ